MVDNRCKELLVIKDGAEVAVFTSIIECMIKMRFSYSSIHKSLIDPNYYIRGYQFRIRSR